MINLTTVFGIKPGFSFLRATNRKPSHPKADALKLYAWLVEHLHPETLGQLKMILMGEITSQIHMSISRPAPSRNPLLDLDDDED